MRLQHYCLSTEDTTVAWIKRFILAEFKVRIVLEEVTGIKDRVEICREHRLSPQVLARLSGGTSFSRCRTHRACQWSRKM
jgi:hypothetical protein